MHLIFPVVFSAESIKKNIGVLRICLTDLFVFSFVYLSSIFIGILHRKQTNKKKQSVEERATTRKKNNRKPSKRKVLKGKKWLE